MHHSRNTLLIIFLALITITGACTKRTETTWATPLQQMLTQTDSNLPKGIFWEPDSMITGDFDLNGTSDYAFLGILPGGLPDPTNSAVLAVLSGDSTVSYVIVPIDGQSGICAPSISLRLEQVDNERPFLTIDDGACDAFRFRMSKNAMKFELFRN